MKKVLITGISGMLGNAVYKCFISKGEYEIYGISRQADYALKDVEMFYGDLSSEEFVKTFSHISFDVVIHCSAEVNVNLCEVNKDLAYNSNVLATEKLFSNISSGKYVYISTDSVFDGKTGNYDESSVTFPLNYYAESKLLGEKAVKSTVDNYYIIRTNIYGFNSPLKSSLFEWGYKELSKGNVINGFSNMYFNPVYVGQLAKFLEELTRSEAAFGTYNIAANEKISKYEFLLKIANEFNFSTELVNDVVFIQDDSSAPRALNTTLNNDKIKENFKDFDFSINTGFLMLKENFTDLKKS